MARQPLSEFCDPSNSLEDAYDYIDSYRAEHDRAQRRQDREQLVCPDCKSVLGVNYRGDLICDTTGVGCFNFGVFRSANGRLIEANHD